MSNQRPRNPVTKEVHQRRSSKWLELLTLLVAPGTGIRRWLVLGAAGGFSLAAGSGYLFRYFSTAPMPDFLPWILESFVFIGLAVIAIAIASWRLYWRISPALASSRPGEQLSESIVRHRQQQRGPRIVAIGGGTGLSTLLRGLKDRSAHITGIVTVADDGGSSGRLRKELGVLPPGDFRNCIVALAETEPLMKNLFEYRFDGGDSLSGHSFGNLFIAAMTRVTGSFEDAIAESSRVLKVSGRIVPSTLEQVTLVAHTRDGSTIRGESQIPTTGSGILELTLEPSEPVAYEQALQAIASAQLIVLGPGSLYTSILPNLMVPSIARALAVSQVPVVYVCNVATQPGETDGYTVTDHVKAIQDHQVDLRIDFVLANDGSQPLGPMFPNSQPVVIDNSVKIEPQLVSRDLMDRSFRGHHDPEKLAEALMELYDINRG